MFLVTNAHGRSLHLCGTCTPRPREAILGFVRGDGVVTVHRKDCRTLRPEKLTGRELKLGWGEAISRQARLITIQVDVYDRHGLLFEMAQLMEHEQINITYVFTPIAPKGQVRLIFSIEVPGPRQLVRILHQIHAIANVFSVRCLPGGPPKMEPEPTTSLYLPE
jgi:GTP pyrophosphokinase